MENNPSLHQLLQFRNKASKSQGINFSVFQALDPDLNATIQEMVYPPKIFPDHPVDLPKHVQTFGEYGDKTGQFNIVEGMVTDRDGNLYVVDRLNQRIQVFNNEGKPVRIYGGNEPLELPVDVSLSENENLLVLDNGQKAIVVFDRDARIINKYALPANSNPKQVAISIDRTILVADSSNKIIRIAVDGTFLENIGRTGTGQLEFNALRGITVNKNDGIIAVADTGNKRIQVLDATGTFKRSIGGNGEAISNAGQIESDNQGNIILTTGQDLREVLILNKDGELQTRWREQNLSGNQGAFDTDRSGNLYVANYAGKNVIRYKPDFTRDPEWHKNQPENFYPSSIHIDKKNNMVWGLGVIEYMPTLFRIDISTGKITMRAPNVSGSSLTMTSQGEILVSKPGYSFTEIKRYSSSGKFLGNLGKDFSFGMASYSSALTGSAFTNEILVHDSQTSDYFRIDQQLNFTGMIGDQFPLLGRIFQTPEKLIHAKNGNIIVNNDYRLRKFSSNGTELSFGEWDPNVTRSRGIFLSPVLDGQENFYAILSNRLVKIDATGNEDSAWGNRVNIVNISSGQTQRFHEIKILCTDGKSLFVLCRTYTNNQWEIWKIAFDGNTFSQLLPGNGIDCSYINRMTVSPQSDFYIYTVVSNQLNLYKFNANFQPDNNWAAKAATVLPAFTSQTVRQVVDMKTSTDNHLYLLFHENSVTVLAKIAPDGTILDKLGGRQTFKATATARIRADQSGGVWIFDMAYNQNRLLHFSPSNWKAPDRIIDAATLPALNGSNDFYFNAGSVKFLFPEMANGFIQFNTYTSASPYTKTELSGKNYFNEPACVSFDPNGKLWVIDFGNKKLVHKLHDSYQKDTSVELPAGIGFDLSMAFDPSGTLFISDRQNQKIYSLNESAKTWTERLGLLLGTCGPGGMTFDNEGNLYLAETNTKRISKIQVGSGSRLTEFTGKSPFTAPMDLAISFEGDLFVLDTSENNIQRIGADGKRGWKQQMEKKSLLRLARHQDKLVVLFKDKTTNIPGLCLLNTSDGAMTPVNNNLEKYKEASCLTFSPSGEIILGGRNFIACLTLQGEPAAPQTTTKWEFREFSYTIRGREKIVRPVMWVQDIESDSDGYIYYTENENGGVVILNGDGKYITHFGTWPHETEKTPSSSHIAIDQDGTIYLNEELQHRIKQYSTWTGKPLPPPKKVQEIIIIDNRPRLLLAAFRQIEERYQHAKDFYETVNKQYETAVVTGMPLEALEALEQKHRNAFKEFMEAENVWLNARERVTVLGLDFFSGTDHMISQLEQMSARQEAAMGEIKTRIAKSGPSLEFLTYRRTEKGYSDQYGINLYNYLRSIHQTEDEKDRWMMIPTGAVADGTPEYIYFIRNPRFSGKKIHPPSFLFEEQYRLETSWKGAGLGEFSNAINLTPGESKEIIITTEKKVSWEETSQYKRRSSITNTREQETAVSRKDNFESSLQDAFERKNVITNTETSEKSTDNEYKFGGKLDLKLAGKIFGLNLGFSRDVSGKHKQTANATRSNTLTDIAKKVTNVVRKTSKDVSDRNKLTFSNLSEQEIERKRKTTGEDIEMQTRKIKVENINEGKTINYLFFQVTNRYATQLWMENVQLNISTGTELIENTGLTLEKNLSVTNFDELLHDEELFTGPQREALVSAIAIAILRRYTSEAGFSDNMPRIIKVESYALRNSPLVRTDIKDLIHQSLYADGLTERSPDFYKKLLEFARLDLTIKPLDLGEQESATVNSGQFYVDTQVGFNNATEAYLEERRRIETELHQALLDESVERARAGIFFPDLPSGITHLTQETKK